MINKENMLKWIEELENTNLNQGTGFLHTTIDGNSGDRYCCLGILCNVAIKNGVDVTINKGIQTLYDDATEMPPEKVDKWIGVDKESIFVKYKGREFPVEYLNDVVKLSFKEIAKLLREFYID